MNTPTPTLHTARAKPLYKQVKSLILDQIDKGELKPHEQIPSEREYSQRTGISRLTVRKALEELTLTGVLYRQPGKGTYVAPAHRARRDVHFSGHTSIVADTEQTTYRLLDCKPSEAPPFAVELLGVSPRTTVVRLEQLIAVRDEPRFIHRGYVPLPVGERLLRMRDIGASPLDLLARYCSDRPATGRDRIEPGQADDRDARLLGIATGAPTQILRGCLFSTSGAPIEAHEVVIRGDRVKLEFEFDLRL